MSITQCCRISKIKIKIKFEYAFELNFAFEL